MHPVFSAEPEPRADAEAARLVGGDAASIDLLHVGSTAPRKQIEPLLRIFAEVRRRHPGARLVRVGGRLPAGARALARSLKIDDALVELRFIDRQVLAAVYRRAAVVLLPSLREGFGWPVLEAMACGTPVVASDIPPHRAIGDDAIDYAPPRDVQAWVEAVDRLLRDREDDEQWRGRREAALERAHRFSLEAYAAGVMDVYRRVLEGG
jgi:glycosyltransferase involved in cell wall biosynthesis